MSCHLSIKDKMGVFCDSKELNYAIRQTKYLQKAEFQ